jgi:transaldolase
MMKSNPVKEVASLGQSIWMDQMRRSLLKTGELKRLIDEDGIRGLTSNPTIFEKAIGDGNDYDDAMHELSHGGASISEIYEGLVVDDIGKAADVFLSVYDSTQGKDGFVSLEVSPLLAHDTQATVNEAKELFARLNRPNVMIKVPATPEGIPAIEELIAAGLNINVTLIFSVPVYESVAEAYIRGLEKRSAAGQPIDRIGSVASFFVSRIDTAVDKSLENLAKKASDPKQKSTIESLMGKAAIANAKLAYRSFQKLFHGERFSGLAAKGAKVQRPLWASTSTKNPKYRDVLYVEQLIGPDTVDTVPPQTLDDFRDHGNVAPTLLQGIDDAPHVFEELAQAGVDFPQITQQLTVDGVGSFAKSFEKLLQVIEERREETLTGTGKQHAS